MELMIEAVRCMGVLMCILTTNIGQNLYDLVIGNLQPVVWIGIAVIGMILLFKRKVTEMVVFVIVAAVAVVLVFNTGGVQTWLLEIANKVLGI